MFWKHLQTVILGKLCICILGYRSAIAFETKSEISPVNNPLLSPPVISKFYAEHGSDNVVHSMQSLKTIGQTEQQL